VACLVFELTLVTSSSNKIINSTYYIVFILWFAYVNERMSILFDLPVKKNVNPPFFSSYRIPFTKSSVTQANFIVYQLYGLFNFCDKISMM